MDSNKMSWTLANTRATFRHNGEMTSLQHTTKLMPQLSADTLNKEQSVLARPTKQFFKSNLSMPRSYTPFQRVGGKTVEIHAGTFNVLHSHEIVLIVSRSKKSGLRSTKAFRRIYP